MSKRILVVEDRMLAGTDYEITEAMTRRPPLSRNIHPSSDECDHLVAIPFICAGVLIAGCIDNASDSVDRRQFLQGYTIMSGIILKCGSFAAAAITDRQY
jgi:hypothetical protein